jgi:hypothetical protein
MKPSQTMKLTATAVRLDDAVSVATFVAVLFDLSYSGGSLSYSR